MTLRLTNAGKRNEKYIPRQKPVQELKVINVLLLWKINLANCCRITRV